MARTRTLYFITTVDKLRYNKTPPFYKINAISKTIFVQHKFGNCDSILYRLGYLESAHSVGNIR